MTQMNVKSITKFSNIRRAAQDPRHGQGYTSPSLICSRSNNICGSPAPSPVEFETRVPLKVCNHGEELLGPSPG